MLAVIFDWNWCFNRHIRPLISVWQELAPPSLSAPRYLLQACVRNMSQRCRPRADRGLLHMTLTTGHTRTYWTGTLALCANNPLTGLSRTLEFQSADSSVILSCFGWGGGLAWHVLITRGDGESRPGPLRKVDHSRRVFLTGTWRVSQSTSTNGCK